MAIWCFQGIEIGCIGNEWVNMINTSVAESKRKLAVEKLLKFDWKRTCTIYALWKFILENLGNYFEVAILEIYIWPLVIFEVKHV